MRRLTSFILICFVVAVIAFLVSSTNNAQPFTPLSIEDNRETDTSPEEITEMMVPISKLFYLCEPSWFRISGAFSPDNRYFAISNNHSDYVYTHLFDLKNGSNVKNFIGKFSFAGGYSFFGGPVPIPVAFSPDSQRLAFIGTGGIVIWGGNKIICQIPLENEKSNNDFDRRVYSLRFSDDGQQLLGVINNTGMVWNAESGAVVKTFGEDIPENYELNVFHCYPDLSHALVSNKATRTGRNSLYNLVTDQELELISNFCLLGDLRQNRSRIVFSDNCQLFAMQARANSNNQVRLLIWDTATGSDLCTVPLAHPLTAYTFLPGSHTLITACDPNPKVAHTLPVSEEKHIPFALPMRKPVAKTETQAIIEFWDINHLIWHKEKANLFPRKIKTYYLEGDDDIHSITASQDGKLLYLRSGKKVSTGRGNAGYGYIVSLDPNNIPKLPATIQINDTLVRLPNK